MIQLSNISDREEIQLGKQINQQLVSNGEIQLYRNPDVNRYVDRIGQRVAANSTRSDISYTFQVSKMTVLMPLPQWEDMSISPLACYKLQIMKLSWQVF